MPSLISEIPLGLILRLTRIDPLMQGRNLGLGLERSPAVLKAQFKAFNFEENVSFLLPAYS